MVVGSVRFGSFGLVRRSSGRVDGPSASALSPAGANPTEQNRSRTLLHPVTFVLQTARSTCQSAQLRFTRNHVGDWVRVTLWRAQESDSTSHWRRRAGGRHLQEVWLCWTPRVPMQVCDLLVYANHLPTTCTRQGAHAHALICSRVPRVACAGVTVGEHVMACHWPRW
jgi:hypothetical protein